MMMMMMTTNIKVILLYLVYHDYFLRFSFAATAASAVTSCAFSFWKLQLFIEFLFHGMKKKYL